MFSNRIRGSDYPPEPPELPKVVFIGPVSAEYATPADDYVCNRFHIQPLMTPSGYALPLGAALKIIEKISKELDEIERKLEKMNV
tara:strand:- start:42160 stop:42414 length:255 start_codon:yes stop_codon:yes gene_type:complete